MKIHVYAALKEYFEPEFELGEAIHNTDELKSCLVAINGQAGDLLDTCKFAVEEGFIDNEFLLQQHDTVIIIPPSSGG
jgi:molybdopterin synthase sulfur carrier subunit